MLNKKILFSLLIFSIFMVATSIIKNKTRIIEKNIFNYQKKIANLKNNLYELQIDYFYLSSPESIEKKIIEHSDNSYESIKFSKIYFNVEQFLNDQKKITLSNIDEKKNQ